jgi:hypothetical protein
MPVEVSLARGSAAAAVVTPEVLLGALNHTMMRLYAAMAFLDDSKLNEDCVDVLRDTGVAESLIDRYMVAVAGPQGVGKTTLVRSFYDLDETWLRDNPGRGERIPVYVLEYPKLKAAEGWLVEIVSSGGERVTESRKSEPEEWRQALAGNLADVLRIELHVPVKFFPGAPSGAAGMLLLPGYELENAENRSWQLPMRRAMVASAAVLLVMNESDLATDMAPVMDDLCQRYQAKSPMVAITHSDHIADDPAAQEKIRKAAAARFGLEGTDGVFCTWLGQRGLALPDVLVDRRVNRAIQLTELDKLIGNKVRPLLRRIAQALDNDGEQSAAAEERPVQDLVSQFEMSRAALRARYERQLSSAVQRVHAEAIKEARRSGSEEIEGYRAVGRRVMNFLRARSGENRSDLEKLTDKAWHPDQSMPSRMAEAMPGVLSEVTQHQLRLKKPDLQVPWSDVHGRAKAAAIASRDGVTISGPVADDLRLLAAPDSQASQIRSSSGFAESIRLIPAMSLAWAWLGGTVPELVGYDPLTGKPASRAAADVAAAAFNDLNAEWLAGMQKAKMAILPVAGLAKAHVTTGHAATGKALVSAAAAGSSAVGAVVTGVVAGAAVAGTAVGAIYLINDNNRKRMSAVENAIGRLADIEYSSRMEAFDDLMDMTQETLHRNLRRMHNVDEGTERRDHVRRFLQRARSQSADLLTATRDNVRALA